MNCWISRQHWVGEEDARDAVYANRRRKSGCRGQALMRRRGEILERTFAHTLDTGGLRRAHVRGHVNVAKRALVQVAAFNLGLLMRKLFNVGKPRALQGAAAAIAAAILAFLRWIVAPRGHSEPQSRLTYRLRTLTRRGRPVRPCPAGTRFHHGLLVVAGRDRAPPHGFIRDFLEIRDLADGSRIASQAPAHKTPIRALVTPTLGGAPHVISAASDGTIRLWDGSLRPRAEAMHEGGVAAMIELSGALVTGGSDGTVRVWDPVGLAPRGQSRMEHDHGVTCLAPATVGERRVIVSGGRDGTVHAYLLESFDPALSCGPEARSGSGVARSQR